MTVPRMMPLTFVVSRIPVAAFFGIRAWRLNKQPIWFACLLPPLLYVTFFFPVDLLD